jgi:hypothetical protein
MKNNQRFYICFVIKNAFRLYVTVILSFFMAHNAAAQNAFLPLSNPVEQLYEPYIHKLSSDMHTSVKPYLLKDVIANSPYDSINTPQVNDSKFSRSLFGRKLLKEHLLSVEEEDYKLFLDPVFEFSAGQDQDYSRNYYTNTRGVWVSGSVGKKFSFNTTFYESQSKFPYYLDSVIGASRIVPGQARIKNFGTSFDYAFATGTINYQLNKHFTFQFGNDKNFFGDGYRSLLLSDNAFNYPYFKIVTDIWKIRYVNVFAVMQDLQKSYINDNEPFRKKYASMHYLDVNIGKRGSVGIFETVIWHGDSLGNRGFDLGYMNPFIFFRPVEFSIGSPDNVLLGINLKFKINSNNQLYGQILLDEFLMKEVKAGNGWWANKQGIQAGFKSFNSFGVQHLNLQGEINYVRPFTYQHRDELGNYGHYRQALAHPLGANFIEGIGIINYTLKKFDLSARLSYAVVGYDTAGLNMGQNIFKSYNDHYQEYDNKVGQGNKHKILWATLSVNYLINPITRMSLFFEGSLRADKSEKQTQSTVLLQGGIRTRLFNRYYDF